MTENTDRDGERTLGAVDHTHPHTNRTFGGNFTFARGGAVAADGGRPDVVPETDTEPPVEGENGAGSASRTLGDVDHTPPNDSEDANRVFARGGEDRPVDDE